MHVLILEPKVQQYIHSLVFLKLHESVWKSACLLVLALNIVILQEEALKVESMMQNKMREMLEAEKVQAAAELEAAVQQVWQVFTCLQIC